MKTVFMTEKREIKVWKSYPFNIPNWKLKYLGCLMSLYQGIQYSFLVPMIEIMKIYYSYFFEYSYPYPSIQHSNVYRLGVLGTGRRVQSTALRQLTALHWLNTWWRHVSSIWIYLDPALILMLRFPSTSAAGLWDCDLV